MRNTTALIAAIALATTTSMAHAGGLSPEIMEAPVVIQEEVAPPAASSVNPLLVVGGILAAVLLFTLLEEDDDDDDEPTDNGPVILEPLDSGEF